MPKLGKRHIAKAIGLTAFAVAILTLLFELNSTLEGYLPDRVAGWIFIITLPIMAAAALYGIFQKRPNQ